jgi:predicted HAD superfamily phosphohydrolase YqeG
MSRLKLRPEECIMVGDQILTDMIAGNLARVRTVLVRPLVQTDQWNTRINRFFERFIMMGMRLRGRLEYKEDIDARR